MLMRKKGMINHYNGDLLTYKEQFSSQKWNKEVRFFDKLLRVFNATGEIINFKQIIITCPCSSLDHKITELIYWILHILSLKEATDRRLVSLTSNICGFHRHTKIQKEFQIDLIFNYLKMRMRERGNICLTGLIYLYEGIIYDAINDYDMNRKCTNSSMYLQLNFK
jgi:hypothetical protein